MEKQQGGPPPVHPQDIQMSSMPQTAGQPLITSQPGGAGQWMAAPAAMPGVPAGLEYLSQVDQVLVHQQIELLELVTSWEMANKYLIKNSVGQQVYFASEESGMCMRQCCGKNRGFIMHISNNFSQEVIRVVRDFKCCGGRGRCCACSRCCQMEVSIEAPVGQVIGYVRQECSICRPSFVVTNAEGEAIFSINGPCCQCQIVCCPKDIQFPVSSADGGHTIGKIYKQWSGFVKEMMTDADKFGVSFPLDLDVKMKAILLGAVFLIDFMYFERGRPKKQHVHHH